MRHQLCNIVTLNLNTTCNLHCKWCYNQEKQHKLLKFELFVKFYDDIIKNNVTTMTLIGGEPTIHPQFMEILRKLEKQDYWVDNTFNDIKMLNCTSAGLLMLARKNHLYQEALVGSQIG